MLTDPREIHGTSHRAAQKGQGQGRVQPEREHKPLLGSVGGVFCLFFLGGGFGGGEVLCQVQISQFKPKRADLSQCYRVLAKGVQGEDAGEQGDCSPQGCWEVTSFACGSAGCFLGPVLTRGASVRLKAHSPWPNKVDAESAELLAMRESEESIWNLWDTNR